MPTRHIPIYRSCNQACPFCEVASQLDGAPVDPHDLRAAIDGAVADGIDEVVLTGGEPTLSPKLVKALAYAHGIGLRTAITTNGRVMDDEGKVGRLDALGLDAIHVSIHGATPAVHARHTGGDDAAFAAALGALRRCAPRFDTTLRMVLTRHNADHVRDLIALADQVGVAFDLRALEPPTHAWALPPQRAVDALLDAARHAHALGVPFRFDGFDAIRPSDAPVPLDPTPVDAPLLELLDAGLRPSAALGGLAFPGPDALAELAGHLDVSEADLPHVLAARRTPILDLPPAAGGTDPEADAHGLDASPLPAWRPLRDGGHVAVVVDRHADPLAAVSALPALARVLETRGVRVTLHSMYRGTFDPKDPSPRRRALGDLLRRRDRRPVHPHDDTADHAAADAALDAIDLSDVDVVVCWGLGAHARWRSHPSLPDTAAVHVVDAAILDALPGVLGPHDVIRSPFPSTAAAYAAAGIPLRHLHWRPLPVFRGHLPEGARDPLRVASDTPPVDDIPPLPADATTMPAHEALAAVATETLWLPVRPGGRPSPWWTALAHAAGVRLVATDTPATADHVRGGVHVRVPPGVPQHRDARARVTAPTPDLVHDVVGWADEILAGAPPVRVVPTAPGMGPFWSW